MTLQNNSNINSNSHKPALESCKAANFHTVGRYLTKQGAVGIEVRICKETGSFAYVGQWGQGSGLDEQAIRSTVRDVLKRWPSAVEVIAVAGIEVSA